MISMEMVKVRAMDDQMVMLAEILQRLKSLEDRMATVERKCIMKSQKSFTLEENYAEPNKSDYNVCLRHHLARHVNSIVGLEEALTWKHRPMKIIWTILVGLGFIGTVYYICTTTSEYLADPTSTTVKLESQKDYSYPYVVLCPPTWLDAGKAFSMGLTIQELQYSLGYFDSEASAPPNATFAKAQLERYFREHNVTSVADFYKSIAVDLEIDQDDAEHENRTASSSFCDGCNETVNAQKIFISPYGICYAYKFLPLDSRHRGWATWSTTRSLSVKVADKTKEVYTHGSNWQLYFMPDLELVQPTSLSLTLQSEAFYLIKVNVDKIVAMPSDKNPCKPPEELNDGDSPDACIAECMNAQARKKFGCSLLPWSTGIIKRPIMEFCNSFDFNTSSGTGAIKNLTAEIERSNMSVCFDQCPFGCEQTIHDSHFVFHGPINPEYYSIVNLTRQLNMTFINVAFTSSALSQGGVLTIREYSTFSFSTFVANVGGTLGLFVGCTILTLAQVVLSLISYFCFRSKGTVDEHH